MFSFIKLGKTLENYTINTIFYFLLITYFNYIKTKLRSTEQSSWYHRYEMHVKQDNKTQDLKSKQY